MMPDQPISTIIQIAVAALFLALGALSLNLLVMWLLAMWGLLPITARSISRAALAPAPGETPRVLLQLPVYNEPAVIGRLMRAVAALDWPRGQLRIQLLDDSTDASAAVAAALVEELHDQGFAIDHIHRDNRVGYKAGALANGLALDDSPYVAMLDADFVPAPDFLRRTVPTLAANPGLAFVQARWEHLNAVENQLTRVQAMMIDAHFMVEQRARSRTALILPFNGTCGVWRRAAIDAAGGWSADTLCEDLDLSIRARLAGWDAIMLDAVPVPGELPATLGAWRTQQFRWTKGFTQVARKMVGTVWRSDLPLAAKLAFTMQTCQPFCYPLTALSLLGSLALLIDGGQGARELSVLGGAVAIMGVTASALCLATGSLALRRGRWTWFPLDIAIILTLNAGLLVSNSRAVWEGLVGKRSPFVRTPKQGTQGVGNSGGRVGPSGAAELTAGGVLAVALGYEAGWASPLFSLTIGGLLLMGGGLARERWIAASRRAASWRPAGQVEGQAAE